MARGLNLLHPQTQAKVEQLTRACAAAGLKIGYADTLRSQAEQDKLYAQGRTAPGSIVTSVKYPNSNHNWGIAVDFFKDVKGHEYDDANFFSAVAVIAKGLGFAWGGDWKTVDKPHLQDKSFLTTATPAALKSKYGTPEAFFKTWPKSAEVVVSVPLPPSPPESKPVEFPVLQQGSKGESVKWLQEKLKKFNYNIVADGDFGAKTLAAVKTFQTSAGLKADGIVGAKTWSAISTRA